MKLVTISLFAILSLSTAACSSTSGSRGPNSAGLEVFQMPGYVNNAKLFRLEDSKNGVVCYGSVASEDSAQASAGHFQCLQPKPGALPVSQNTP